MQMDWQGAMADVVNHHLVWLLEIMKTRERKAETTCAMVDGSLYRGFFSLQILLFSLCNGLADRAHWSSSQHVFSANWCACVEPSGQYHIYSVLATLLGLLLRDMGMHGAHNPDRNNPSWLAPRLWQAHVDSWPCHQSLTGTALPQILCRKLCNCQGATLLPEACLSFSGLHDLQAALLPALREAVLRWLQQCLLTAEPPFPTAKPSGQVRS